MHAKFSRRICGDNGKEALRHGEGATVLAKAIAKKTAAYRDGSPPKEELIRKARSLGIKGRSAMTKGELSSAIASRWRGPSASASRAGTTRP